MVVGVSWGGRQWTKYGGLLQARARANADAEPLSRQALALFEKSLGPDYPNVATSLNNLAHLFKDINRLAEAVSTKLGNLRSLVARTTNVG